LKRHVGSRNHLKLPGLLSLGTGYARLENDEKSEREADRAGDGVGYSFRGRLQMEKARKTGAKTGRSARAHPRWRSDTPSVETSRKGPATPAASNFKFPPRHFFARMLVNEFRYEITTLPRLVQNKRGASVSRLFVFFARNDAHSAHDM
jgi:hypothetical protein